jgi:hypothetical protein
MKITINLGILVLGLWYYDSIGIYDAIKNTYTIKGDLINNSIY